MPHRPDPNFAQTNPLAGWIEVFRAGRHTDSAGKSRTWTTAELDQIVRNHSDADAAPAVIGHPRTDDPAYAWTAELKREGKRLYARFKDWVPEFASMIREGRFRKRSVRVSKTSNGWKLMHVGWLGATPPAVEGLQALGYSAPDGEYHDFEMPDWFTPNVISRAFRRMRDFLIEQFGLELADKVMPNGEIEALDEHADTLRNRPDEDNGTNEGAPSFSRPPAESEEDDMPDEKALEKARDEARQKAEADFEKERQTLRERAEAAERKARVNEFNRAIEEAIDAGRLTPAQAEGMAEFAAALPDADDQAFEFSRGEGDKSETVKKTPGQWFQDFLKSLPKQVETGETDLGEDPETGSADGTEFAGIPGTTVDEDRMKLHKKALDYQRKNGGPDKVDYMTAVRAVEVS